METKGSLLHLQVAATCLYAEPHRSSWCPQPTSWIFILILFSHLCLVLKSGLFPPGVPTKTLCAPFLSPHMLHASPISFLSIWSPKKDLVKSSLCKFSPFPCYLIPLRPKYSPQHPTLKHPQPMFLPHCQQPSFTPIQSNNQNYSSVYILIFIFLDSKLRQKILHWIITSIPGLKSALNFFLNRILIS